MKKYNQRLVTLWIPLIVAVIIYSFGDVLLKQGNMDIGSTIESLFEGSFWIALLLSWPIILAFALTMASKMLMSVVLSKNDLGVSEGLFLAASIGALLILGVVFFAETVNLVQLAGLGLLMVGILFISEQKEDVPEPVLENEQETE